MFSKQFPLLSNTSRDRIFHALMQAKENGFAVVTNARLPFASGPMRVHSNNAAARIALRSRPVHPVLLVRYLAQILDSVISAITIDVVNLIGSGIFSCGQCPYNAMCQIAAITNADAYVPTALNNATGNSARLDASLRCAPVKQAITQLKQAMQLFNGREGFRLGYHLNASEVATGQGVGSTAAPQFYIGGSPC